MTKPCSTSQPAVSATSPVEPELVRHPFSTLRANEDARLLLLGPPPFEEDYPNPDAFQRAFDAWSKHASFLPFDRERTAGTLLIRDMDLAGSDYLVVTGPARGAVWQYREGDDDLSPGTDDNGTPLTFASWFSKIE